MEYIAWVYSGPHPSSWSSPLSLTELLRTLRSLLLNGWGVPGPAAMASPGNSLEIRLVGPTQTYWSRNCISTRYLGNSWAPPSLRSTGLATQGVNPTLTTPQPSFPGLRAGPSPSSLMPRLSHPVALYSSNHQLENKSLTCSCHCVTEGNLMCRQTHRAFSH